MIFHSLDYLVFLVVVLAVYWRLPLRGQNLLLLGASYLFYGYVHPWFLVPFFITTVVDYAVAVGIEDRPAARRTLLIASLVSNLGMLAVFKYFGFFVDNVAALLEAVGLPAWKPALRLVLPVGISFYTFQSLGYIFDVYRGHLRACRSFPDYALFVAFFPQLVAGPIERAGRLIAQVQRPRSLAPERAEEALLLMLWGFYKKVVIADNVAITANKVFALEDPGFPMLWAGVFAFGVQIYADFSAYTDIARGSARLLGFELMENFNHPYLSRTPAEFWRRWHISLSSWFRDYVYIPLGGSRATPGRAAFNLVFTFFLSGLWHGASWNFVLWGLYWGLLVWLYRLAEPLVPRPLRGLRWLAPLQVLGTFLLAHLGWLMFREQNFAYLLRHLSLSPFGYGAEDWQAAGYLSCLTLLYSLPLWLHMLVDGLILQPRRERVPPEARRERSAVLRTALAVLLFVGILVLRSTVTADFIYFQF